MALPGHISYHLCLVLNKIELNCLDWKMWRIDVCIIRITTVSLFFKHNYTEPEVFKELQFVGPQHWRFSWICGDWLTFGACLKWPLCNYWNKCNHFSSSPTRDSPCSVLNWRACILDVLLMQMVFVACLVWLCNIFFLSQWLVFIES